MLTAIFLLLLLVFGSLTCTLSTCPVFGEYYSLEAISRNVGTVTMAGFKPEEVKKALKLPDNEQPVYIMPIGKR